MRSFLIFIYFSSSEGGAKDEVGEGGAGTRREFKGQQNGGNRRTESL